MRLIEIRSDEKTVIIDGVSLKLDFDLGENDDVVYWDESVESGWVDGKDGKGRKIKSLDEFSDIIEAFKAKAQSQKKTDFSMRIVPDDRLVTIGDMALEFDFDIDPNYHAVHWDGEKGFIETKQGLNLTLVDTDEFADIIAGHAAIKEEKDKEQKAREAEFNLPENVAKREIIALENEITPRRMREAMLTDDGKTWLAAQEEKIEALRSTANGK